MNQDINVKQKYKLIVPNDHFVLNNIEVNSNLQIRSPKKNLSLQVLKIEKIKGGINWVFKDFRRLFKAVFQPLKSASSRSKFLSILFVYIFLPTGLASFFVRGWRLEVVRRMSILDEQVSIAPLVSSLHQLGEFLRQGIRLLGAKALYDLPKIFLLVAIGYDHYEMILEWGHYFLEKLIGGNSFQGQSFSSFSENSFFKFKMTLLLQLFFVAAYSIFVTPAFRITMIKYANGKIDYKGFFNLNELKDSYRIYKKYKVKTLEAYFWDVLVSGLSLFLGFVLMILFAPFIWIVIPCYKLLFKHWPKAYGYGWLARKLIANDEI